MKMLPAQYLAATTKLKRLGWIARGASTNMVGGKMFFVTPKGKEAYCHALFVTKNNGPKWNCPKFESKEAPSNTQLVMREFWELHHDGIHINGLLERMFNVLGDTFKGKLKVTISEMRK